MWQLVEDLRQLMGDLSLYSPQFLQIMINLLERYRDSCNLMYRGEVAPAIIIPYLYTCYTFYRFDGLW